MALDIDQAGVSTSQTYHCKNDRCGHQEIKIAIFKGSGFCSVDCQKDYQTKHPDELVKERQWNELNPHPSQLTELEKKLIEVIGYLSGQLNVSRTTISNHQLAKNVRKVNTTVTFPRESPFLIVIDQTYRGDES